MGVGGGRKGDCPLGEADGRGEEKVSASAVSAVSLEKLT